MRPEYDFKNGVKGKYAKRFSKGSNVVVLDADLIESFPDSNSVNDALRVISKIAKRKKRKVAA